MSKAMDACATIFMEGQEIRNGVCNVYQGRCRSHDYGFVYSDREKARKGDDEWLLYRVVVKVKEK